jgi:hypothetical protein
MHTNYCKGNYGRVNYSCQASSAFETSGTIKSNTARSPLGEGTSLHVRLEASPKGKHFKERVSAINRTFPVREERGAAWVKDVDSPYRILMLSRPLHTLLTEDDQQAAVATFVNDALSDLIEAGVLPSLQEVAKRGPT